MLIGVEAPKAGVPVLRVVLLIALIIGPGEELFWRGFFQDRTAATTRPVAARSGSARSRCHQLLTPHPPL